MTDQPRRNTPQGVDLNADEQARRRVMTHSPVVAIVGWSDDAYYTSNQVGEYLESVGYKVYHINPRLDNPETGAAVYDSLADIPEHIDIVDVFRKDSAVPRVVEEAIAVGATTVWAQLGVISEEARTQALAAGLNYGDNLCLRTEHEAMMGNVVEG